MLNFMEQASTDPGCLGIRENSTTVLSYLAPKGFAEISLRQCIIVDASLLE